MNDHREQPLRNSEEVVTSLLIIQVDMRNYQLQLGQPDKLIKVLIIKWVDICRRLDVQNFVQGSRIIYSVDSVGADVLLTKRHCMGSIFESGLQTRRRATYLSRAAFSITFKLILLLVTRFIRQITTICICHNLFQIQEDDSSRLSSKCR